MIFYPLNNIQYSAEDAQLFNCTRKSGVYSSDDFRCEVTGLDNNVTVNLGVGWMRLDRFKGGVFALKDVAETIDLGIADDTLPRIDVVGVQFSANDNAIKIFSKQGTPATQPKIPPIVQTADTNELYFCSIKRPAGATEITPDMVTDLRLDSNYCGLMADSITKIDTKAINEQIQALIDELEEEIKGVRDGSAFVLKSEVIDSIEEQGTDGSWIYRKWKSGIAECWKTVEITTKINQPYGSVFVGNAIPFQNYPFEFKETPVETISICGDEELLTIRGGECTTVHTSKVTPALASGSQSRVIKIKANYYVIGQLKGGFKPIINGNEVAY